MEMGSPMLDHGDTAWTETKNCQRHKRSFLHFAFEIHYMVGPPVCYSSGIFTMTQRMQSIFLTRTKVSCMLSETLNH